MGFDHIVVPLPALDEARELLGAWRDDYNRFRPHSALVNRTPEEFHDHHLALALMNDQVQKTSPGLTILLDERWVSGQRQ